MPPVATPPLNITIHIEAAVLDCLQNVEDAFPFAVSRIRAGRTSFDTYTPMAGDGDLSQKDFIRLGFGAYDLNPTYTVETTDDTWTTILSIALAEDETAHVRATVLGKKDSISTSDDICPLTAEAQFYRLSGGDVTQFGVNGIHKAQTSNGMARWNTTSTHIQLQVQGVSAEDWRWSARITEKQID